MDWLPGFKDWLFSNLDLLANLGSLAGFISAGIIFFRARALRKHYMLLTRGLELLDDLDKHSSALNDLLDARYQEVISYPILVRKVKPELDQCRSTIRGLSSKVPLKARWDLYNLHRTIKRAQKDITEERVFDIYSELLRVAGDIKNHIKDTKARA